MVILECSIMKYACLSSKLCISWWHKSDIQGGSVSVSFILLLVGRMTWFCKLQIYDLYLFWQKFVLIALSHSISLYNSMPIHTCTSIATRPPPQTDQAVTNAYIRNNRAVWWQFQWPTIWHMIMPPPPLWQFSVEWLQTILKKDSNKQVYGTSTWKRWSKASEQNTLCFAFIRRRLLLLFAEGPIV